MAPHISRDQQSPHFATSTASVDLQRQVDRPSEPGFAPNEDSLNGVGDGEQSIGSLEDAAFAAMDMYEAELTPLVDAKRRARQVAECKRSDIKQLRTVIGKLGLPSESQLKQLNALRREYLEACHTIKTLVRRADIAKKRAVASLVEEAQILHGSWGEDISVPSFGDYEAAATLHSHQYADLGNMAFPPPKATESANPQAVVTTCQSQVVRTTELLTLDAHQTRAAGSKAPVALQEQSVQMSGPRQRELDDGSSSDVIAKTDCDDWTMGQNALTKAASILVSPAQSPIVQETNKERERSEEHCPEKMTPVEISVSNDITRDRSQRAPATADAMREEALNGDGSERSEDKRRSSFFESAYHFPSSDGSTVYHVPSSDGSVVVEPTGEPPAIPIDPCTVAFENLKQCEWEHWNRKNDLEKHLGTYNSQFAQYCESNPISRPKWLADAFGQVYNKRTRDLTILLTQAQERLRSARLDAKNAGVSDPNSPDQTSDFLSTSDDGPNPEVAKLSIDSCDHERILEWQKAPVKAKKMELSELKFATSRAEVDTWNSLSARGSPSKRRKIDENFRWVKSDPDLIGSEGDRSRPRKQPEGSNRRRAKSEAACVRKPMFLFSELLSGDETDYQFSFTYPVADDTVWTKVEDWDDIIIVDD